MVDGFVERLLPQRCRLCGDATGGDKDDEQDGLWTYWDENGEKLAEAHYKNGDEVSRKDF